MDRYTKDPDDVLDYKINWSSWLSGDTIATSAWTKNSTDIDIDSIENTTTQTVVWVSGGEVGRSYTFTNHIVTAAGREKDYSIIISIEEE